MAEKELTAEQLDRDFFYDGKLGNCYTKDETEFRVWAPLAEEAKLVTYDSWDSTEGRECPMDKAESGTWRAVLEGNQDGLIYMYKIKIGSSWREAADPYARALTVNGERGVVIDKASSNPERWTGQKPELPSKMDTVIYEMHIRDFSIHPESGILHKGKYLGAAETGTRGPGGIPTGLDHVKSLGVTHVQLLPIFDYATVDESKPDVPQYNWGYDPKNYNAPEGSYSSNPYDPKARIRELKQLIQTLHDQGMRVIMDVVFNHVHSVEDSSFEKLVPGYYFRRGEDGALSNGSGVGNDTASERKMMRKFIIDSVVYWAEEYHLDGFRFDLMGIHDVETMNELRQALDQVDPSLLILGEGWDLATELEPERKASQKNAASMPGIAHFNDHLRDSLKGSALEEGDAGYVNGQPGKLEDVRKGIEAERSTGIYTSPDQVITYVEAHDNHTLWDKLGITNSDASFEKRQRMHRLASAIVLTSQGIPFLHAGQEFMRTKNGVGDSYNSPDGVNQLDWRRCADNQSNVAYIRGLIALRKQFKSLKLESYEEIEKKLKWLTASEPVLAYYLEEDGLVVIHNAGEGTESICLPEKAHWDVLVNEDRAGTEAAASFEGETVEVAAYSSLVLKRKES